jgi:hypothetical protein
MSSMFLLEGLQSSSSIVSVEVTAEGRRLTAAKMAAVAAIRRMLLEVIEKGSYRWRLSCDGPGTPAAARSSPAVTFPIDVIGG